MVENGVDWRSKVKAAATMGAATLSPDELGRLTFNVRRNETTDFKFDLNGTIVLAKSFANPRKVSVGFHNFVLGSGE